MQVVEEGKVGIQGALNAKERKGPAVASVLQSAGVLPGLAIAGHLQPWRPSCMVQVREGG